jgi:hypothetical protein
VDAPLSIATPMKILLIDNRHYLQFLGWLLPHGIQNP